MKKFLTWLLLILSVFCAGCGNKPAGPESTPEPPHETSSENASPMGNIPQEETIDLGEETMDKTLRMLVGGAEVSVTWEENASVDALTELVKTEPIVVQLSMYGGFEQVGHLGTSLPRDDAQTTTQAGDIVLYSGSQIVIFYGSNSWAYTRLGRITDKSEPELKELLGNGDVSITLSLK